MRVGLPHPEKVRHAIVRAFHKEGFTYAEIATMLDIGVASVSRILRLYRETGRIQPRPRGPGRTSPITGKVADRLRRLVQKRPDTTTAELLGALVRETGVQTSLSAVKRAMHRLGFSRKKRSSSPASVRRPTTNDVGG
jgi:transposase